ncbi:hypothetical protein pb186bvf_017395 [Paramecium bursaria]
MQQLFLGLMSYLYFRIRYLFSNPQIQQSNFLIVGLGNPGKSYQNTRHNVGQQFVNYLAKDLNVQMTQHSQGMIGQYKGITLFNPNSFMNLSGGPVKKIYQKYSIQQLLVVHDDLDQQVGKCKIKVGGSAEGHNGLKSIIQSLNPNFQRLKIGIGRPDSKEPDIVADYVLGRVEHTPTQQSFKIARELIKKTYNI